MRTLRCRGCLARHMKAKPIQRASHVPVVWLLRGAPIVAPRRDSLIVRSFCDVSAGLGAHWGTVARAARCLWNPRRMCFWPNREFASSRFIFVAILIVVCFLGKVDTYDGRREGGVKQLWNQPLSLLASRVLGNRRWKNSWTQFQIY